MKHLSNKLILCSSLLMGVAAITTSCSNKDLFDQDAYTEELSKSFPVTNIDANQTWATVGVVTINASVSEEAGTYTIKVYDENPLSNSSAVELAKGTVANGGTWSGTVDYPLAYTTLYVSRVDSKARREVAAVQVTNGGNFDVTFDYGTSASASAVSRANSDVEIPTMEAPYTYDQVTNLLKKATNVSTVANLPQGGNTVYYANGYNGDINCWGGDGKSYTLIVNGKWTFNGVSGKDGSDNNCLIQQIATNLTIIVANGGEINIPSGKDLQSYGNGKIIVMKGGKVTGDGELEFSNGGTNYNAGSITVGTMNNNGGYFYNAAGAEFKISNLYKATTSNSTFVNWSDNVVINSMPTAGNGSNSILKTGCKITVTNVFSSVQTYIGRNASIECGSYFTDNVSAVYFGKFAILQANNRSSFQNTNLVGPSEGYAIFKTNGWLLKNPFTASGKLYIDNVWTNDDQGSDSQWQETQSLKNLPKSVNLVDIDCAAGTIPATDCTIGYKGDGKGGDTDGSEFETTFCFEDNYPAAGDYDFNDAVIGVKRTVKDKVVTLVATLKAVGATLKSGAAIRLSGIAPSSITSVTSTGLTNTAYGDRMEAPGSNGYLTSKDGSSVVIPLYGDAHKALGSDERTYINTSKTEGKTATPVAITITINTTSADVAKAINSKSVDVFIYNGKGEVHTYPWKDANAALYNLAEGKSDKVIWAISIPNFKYPIEYKSIELAYPNFEDWAHDANSNLNWYTNSVSGYVY